MPGTRFTKTELINELTARFDDEIAELEGKLEEENAVTDEMRLDLWREQCRSHIRDLAARLDDVSDLEISGFRLPHSPAIGDHRYEIRNLERSIASKITAKNKALAYARALKADDDDVVEVYAADLRRIGYEA